MRTGVLARLAAADSFNVGLLLGSLFLSYAAGYITLAAVVGSSAAGWLNLAVQLLFHCGIAATAIYLSFLTAGSERLSYGLIAVAGGSGLIVDGAYNYLVNINPQDTNYQLAATLFYHIPWVVFLIAWIAAVAVLLRVSMATGPSEPRAAIIAACVMTIGYSVTYWMLFSPVLAAFRGPPLARAFHFVFAIFEGGAFVVGLLALMFSRNRAIATMIAGILILLAHDVVFQMEEIAGAKRPLDFLELSWSFALAVILFGMFLAFRDVKSRREASHFIEGSPSTETGIRIRGFLTAICVSTVVITAFLFTTVLYDSSEQLEDMKRIRYSLFGVDVFLVGFVVALGALEDAIERVIGEYRLQARQLFDGEVSGLSDSYILKRLGLDTSFDHLLGRWREHKSASLLLGHERVFMRDSWPKSGGSSRSCFVAMPFSPPWSRSIYEAITRAAAISGFECSRADEIFGRNVMEDVWSGVLGSAVVIADLTGRNPNVLYEVGLAHTLAKPVILLSRNKDEIPFDLAARRVIIYGDCDVDGTVLSEGICRMLKDIAESILDVE